MLKLLVPSKRKTKTEQPNETNRTVHSDKRKRNPYTFEGDLTFYDCQLPPLASLPGILGKRFSENVLDKDMTFDLGQLSFLNHFSIAQKLHSVRIPRDGDCFLHSVSVAVWGARDSQNSLRDLMAKNMKKSLNFKTRWLSRRTKDYHLLKKSQQKIFDNEWNDVVQDTSNLGTAALPLGEFNNFHIYVLANILRRPILVITNSLTKSSDDSDRQENSIGGMYLPLEWPPLECCKTPIVLGYRSKHFCPLISEAHAQDTAQEEKKNKSTVFPLVTDDFGLLTVQCLKDEESSKAWDLVQSYLLVKEADVISSEGTVIKVPCAQMILKPLESTSNPFFKYLEYVKEKLTTAGFLYASQGPLYPTLETTQNSHLYNNIEIRADTELLPKVTDHPLTPTAPFPSLELDSHIQMPSMMEERCRNKCGYRCSNQTYPFCHECYQTEVQGSKNIKQISNIVSAPLATTETAENQSMDKKFVSGTAEQRESSLLNLKLTLTNSHTSQLTVTNSGSCSNQLDLCSSENSPCQKKSELFIHADVSNNKSQISKRDLVAKNGEQTLLNQDVEFSHFENKERTRNSSDELCESDRPFRICKDKPEEQHISSMENFAETKNFQIVKVSRENQCKVKCANPFCKTFICGSDQMCNECMDVLKQNSQNNKEKEQLKVFMNSSHESKHSATETEARKKSCRVDVKNPSGFVQAGMSCYGSYIHQASEDMSNKESLSQNFDKNCLLLNEYMTSSALKMNDSTSLPSKCPAGVSAVCMDINKLSVSSHGKEHIAFECGRASIDEQNTKYSLCNRNTPFSIPATVNTLSSSHSGLPAYTSVNTSICLAPVSADTLSPVYSWHQQSSQQYDILPDDCPQFSNLLNNPQPKSVTVTSMTKYVGLKSINPLAADLSSSFNQGTNQHSTRGFQEIEQKWKTSATKCRSSACQNYGNSDKGGYCNACHKVIRKQRILEEEAKRGMDVPDSAIT